MKDFWWGIAFGFMIAIFVVHSPWGDISKYRKAIEECERTLPRDQQCKVIGVPHVPK